MLRTALLGCLALLTSLRAAPPAAPPRLSQTGLYRSPGAVDPRHLAFTPQYPLWTDGAAKARWIHLPPGTAIDGRREDAWVFPVGTKVWKEFAFQGRRVETRFLWKTGPAAWVAATYLWTADQRDAVLAPAGGADSGIEVAPGLTHRLPSQADCRACHGTGPLEVLGFSALQLSPDRDPGALHGEPLAPGAVTLRELVDRGLLKGVRPDLLSRPPRIPGDPATRTALGYLQTHCASCHRADRPIPGLALDLRPAHALRTAPLPGQYRLPGEEASAALVPGHPDRSSLLHRMGSRSPLAQMPSMGTALVDEAALAHLRRWIAQLPASH